MNGVTWPRRLACRTRIVGRAVLIVWALGGLAVVGYRARASDGDPTRDRVVALVGRLEGDVRHDESSPARPIIEIRLAATRVSDDQLGELRGLSSLRSLDLNQTRISDAGLARLRGHEGLRSLLLYETKVTDRGFEHIATLSGLETLLVGILRRVRPGTAPPRIAEAPEDAQPRRAGSHRFRAGGPGGSAPSRTARPGRVEDHRRGARTPAGPLPAAAARPRWQRDHRRGPRPPGRTVPTWKSSPSRAPG